MIDNLLDEYTTLDIILGRTGIDKNSRRYDEALLKELVGVHILGNRNKFLTGIRKYMKCKSSAKLWYEFKDTERWNGKEYQKCNFVCCPSSHKARSYFCFIVNENEYGYKITNGFLSEV